MHSVFLEFLPTLYPTNISAAYIVSAEQTEKSGKILKNYIASNHSPCKLQNTPGGGGGGPVVIFWGGMCPPGLQIGTPFYKKNSPKIDTLF